jgi:hypothetical protein
MIHHHALESASVITLAAGTIILGIMPNEGDFTILIQAGMAGIVLLLLLKFIPDLMKANAEQMKLHQNAMESITEAHRVALDSLVKSFEQHDSSWRELLTRRGYCPVRDSEENHGK